MKKIIQLIAVFIICAMFAGCSTVPICVTSSITPLQDKTVTENLGQCSGSSSAYSILGLFMIGRPDINEAISNALDTKKGDTLINVRCYEKTSNFIIFTISTVIVEGEAVKFGQAAAGEEKKGKGK